MSSLNIPLSPNSDSDAKPAAAAGGGGGTRFWIPIIELLHLVVALGGLLAADKLTERAFAAGAIKFPSSVFGLFCVFSVLMVLDYVAPARAVGIVRFFEPATGFIQRWLPLFYVPPLVVLPLAVKDIPADSLIKILFIIVGGWLASLVVAGYTAITVRRIVRTEMMEAEPMARPSRFTTLELWSWTAFFVSTFIIALINPTALGTSARTCLPFLLAVTVLGYMVGSRLPEVVKKILHPIVCCVIFAELAAVAFGYFSQTGIDAVLGNYLTKVPSDPGAGDVLMLFLGSVVLSFAFFMFKQRKLVKRHAPEIFSSAIISTIFSLYSTAIAGRLVGLEPRLTIFILPRCITLALALSIVSLFEGANSSLTAAVVVLTGLLGANFVQIVMDKLRLHDPVARGIATASRILQAYQNCIGGSVQAERHVCACQNRLGVCTSTGSEDHQKTIRVQMCRACTYGDNQSSHGFGTSALAAKEPEALPFCAIAYSLTGIFATLLCSAPAVRESFYLIAG